MEVRVKAPSHLAGFIPVAGLIPASGKLTLKEGSRVRDALVDLE